MNEEIIRRKERKKWNNKESLDWSSWASFCQVFAKEGIHQPLLPFCKVLYSQQFNLTSIHTQLESHNWSTLSYGLLLYSNFLSSDWKILNLNLSVLMCTVTVCFLWGQGEILAGRLEFPPACFTVAWRWTKYIF